MFRILHARAEAHYDQVRALLQEYRDATHMLAEAAGACT
jgi:hypothetical protein